MKELIAVDPGLRHCGVAMFWGGELKAAGLVKNPNPGRGPGAWFDMAGAVILWLEDTIQGFETEHCRMHESLRGFNYPDRTGLVLEVMQIYGGPRKEDPNDLLELNGVQGALVGRFIPDEITHYLPRQWKGQVPKDVMCRRIMKPGRLTKQELENTGLVRADNTIGAKHPNIPTHLLHNVLDAIGIGLHHLNRLG